MRRIWGVILLGWVLFYGPFLPVLNAQWLVILSSKTPVAASNITANLWCTMETATPTGSGLSSVSSGSLAAGTTFTSAGTAVTTAAGAQQALVSTVNTSATTGSLGLAGHHDTPGWCRFELASATATQSVCFTLKVTSLSSGTFTVPTGWGESVTLTEQICYLRVENNAGTYTIFLKNSGGSSSTVTISANTFYILSVKVVSNSTCSLNVYSTAGVQQGSTVTLAGINKSFFYHFLGCLTSDSTAGDDYIDNYCINTATAPFPFGP